MISVICDLEFNKPPTESLLQIGAVAMNMKTGKVVSRFNVFINPQEAVHQEIIELTGITQEQADNGLPLVDALTMFWSWAPSKNMAAWGDDVGRLIDEAEHLDVAVPKYLNILDLKEMASHLRCAFPSHKSRGGLKATLDLFGLEFEGRQHNAIDDAYNTALLAHHFVTITRKFYEIKDTVAL